MNGRKLYVMPATTATALAVTFMSCGISVQALAASSTTKPSSARICRQAIVRRMKLVKNGATTSTSRRLRQRPALNAMRYASG